MSPSGTLLSHDVVVGECGLQVARETTWKHRDLVPGLRAGVSAHCWVLRGRPTLLLFGVGGLCVVSGGGHVPGSCCGGGRGVVRVVVENCTVDASIFCFCAVFCRIFLIVLVRR